MKEFPLCQLQLAHICTVVGIAPMRNHAEEIMISVYKCYELQPWLSGIQAAREFWEGCPQRY